MRKIFAVVALICIVLVPALVLAAEPESSTAWTTGLVPCGNTGTTADATDCDIYDLVNMGVRIMNFLFFASILLTVVLLVKTGFEYVSAGSNTGQLAKAKSRFLTIGIGFLLVLGAWTIINAAVSILLDPESGVTNPLSPSE